MSAPLPVVPPPPRDDPRLARRSCLGCFLAAVIAAVVVPALMWGLYVHLDADHNIYASETHSPDDKYKALVYERDWGAMHPYIIQVCVVRSSYDGHIGEGNVLATCHKYGSIVGGPEVQTVWTGPRDLLVLYEKGAHIRYREERVGEVRIRFRELTLEQLQPYGYPVPRG